MTTMQYKKDGILLDAKGVGLTYGDKVILNDVNIQIQDIIRPGIQQGQIVSLIGRSGMGKTQLFRILSGLQKQTVGEVVLGHRDATTGAIATDRHVQAGDVGVVFQNYYQFGWRTVKKSLQMAASRNPLLKGKDDETIAAYAEKFAVQDHLNKYPNQLSGGQQQRISIMQQLLKGSNFLLLDEPFSGLDAIVLDDVTDMLLKVSLEDELKTLIVVSHDIPTTVAISDTVFLLGKHPSGTGSTVIEMIDLIERDLAWHTNVKDLPAFKETVNEIKSKL